MPKARTAAAIARGRMWAPDAGSGENEVGLGAGDRLDAREADLTVLLAGRRPRADRADHAAADDDRNAALESAGLPTEGGEAELDCRGVGERAGRNTGRGRGHRFVERRLDSEEESAVHP